MTSISLRSLSPLTPPPPPPRSYLSLTGINRNALPDGSNSYFRQLDFILSTIANEEFNKLFRITDVGLYATLKNAIFARYRTLAEIYGALFVQESVKRKMNVFIETSGRDTSMFDYVNYNFPEDEYHRCVVHFTINDVKYAEQTVDKRMRFEMKKGAEALTASSGSERVLGVIEANSGGPFGSAHLAEVSRQSELINEKIFSDSVNIGKNWFKAQINVKGREEGPWAVFANVKNCTEFTFLSSIMFEGGRADVRREVKF